MGRVARHIAHSGCADRLPNLLVAELVRNKQQVQKNTGVGRNYSQAESADTLAILDDEITVCNACSAEMAADSIPGETTIPLLFGARFKCVDVATLRSGHVSLSECKVAMKRTGTGPFYDENAFVAKVAGKFDEVESRMLSDNDTVAARRFVVVSDAVMDRAVEMVDDLVNLQLPDGSFSSDGQSHNYVLCTPSTLNDVINGACAPYPVANCYAFVL